MKQIPLTKIGFFNPGRLSDEEIEQMFVTRVAFFEHLFKKIIAEKPGSIPQHYLVIGQRGMGKTSLLVRIAAELRKQSHKNSFIALSFPEEQYNVDRLSKFWLNCMDALADALDREGNKEELPLIDKEIQQLAKDKTADANSIYEAFEKWTAKLSRRPVLLVDNLNLIFDKINKDEQHQLRGILMSKGAPILVGASATPIDGTVEYGAPFYDAFQISYLKKLTFEESLEVLLNLAKITGNKDFEPEVYKHRGRLQALYQLTGGTPRTIAILFPLIQGGFSEKIQTDLDALLDTVTPLYKARFEELSPQLQVVLDAVALHWDPATIEQLRDITHLENTQLAPQLKRLYDVGWLQKLDAYEAKGSAYELSERFFNIWYLMRRSSRRQKRELYCLTRFLETFYGDSIEEFAQNRIREKCLNINQITIDLALADAIKNEDLKKLLFENSYNAIFELSIENDELLQQFSIPDGVKSNKLIALVSEVPELLKNKDNEKAEKNLKQALNIREDINTLSLLGILYSGIEEKKSEALALFEKAINKGMNNLLVWTFIGDLYANHSNEYEKAEKAYMNAILLDENNIAIWEKLGALRFTKLKKYIDTEFTYKKLIDLDKSNLKFWVLLGFLYHINLKKYSEAEIAYTEAIKLNETEPLLWAALGLVHTELRKYSEAREAYEKAISLGAELALPWNALGNLYQDIFKEFVKAEEMYKKAIEIDPDDISIKNNLIFLWRDKLQKHDEAKELLNTLEKENKKDSSYYLNKAIFLFYEKNVGLADISLQAAIQALRETKLFEEFKEDWYRSVSVIINMGYGLELLDSLAQNDGATTLLPFFAAIKFFVSKQDEQFLHSLAAEVREPAKIIIEQMKNYMK